MKTPIYILIGLCSLILTACECVVNLDTEKEIDPKNAANLVFLHAMPDQGALYVESDGMKVYDDLDYDDTAPERVMIGDGRSNIRLKTRQNNSTLFNSLADFKKDNDYSAIAYGYGYKVQLKILRDSIDNYNPANPYIRFIHLCGDLDDIKFEFTRQFTIVDTVSYESFTSLLEVSPGTYSLAIYDKSTDSLLHKRNEINITAGKIYNLVLRGYAELGKGKPLSVLISEAERIGN